MYNRSGRGYPFPALPSERPDPCLSYEPASTVRVTATTLLALVLFLLQRRDQAGHKPSAAYRVGVVVLLKRLLQSSALTVLAGVNSVTGGLRTQSAGEGREDLESTAALPVSLAHT